MLRTTALVASVLSDAVMVVMPLVVMLRLVMAVMPLVVRLRLSRDA